KKYYYFYLCLVFSFIILFHLLSYKIITSNAKNFMLTTTFAFFFNRLRNRYRLKSKTRFHSLYQMETDIKQCLKTSFHIMLKKIKSATKKKCLSAVIHKDKNTNIIETVEYSDPHTTSFWSNISPHEIYYSDFLAMKQQTK
ncbi:hypothetical protein ACJX0J_014158, partial [Zea mays]